MVSSKIRMVSEKGHSSHGVGKAGRGLPPFRQPIIRCSSVQHTRGQSLPSMFICVLTLHRGPMRYY